MSELLLENISIQLASRTLIKELFLHCKPGQIWGVLGPNGCGKTTFLHTLAKLHTDYKGNIYLEKQLLSSYTPKELARLRGILLQGMLPPFPQTVWEYCSASRFAHKGYFEKLNKADEAIIETALEKMSLLTFKKRLIATLSGGEQRRLQIAAVLAQTPHLFLLDEPTNHLDISHQLQVMTYLRYLADTQPVTMMIALHDIYLAQQFCDHVLLLYPNGQWLAGKTIELLNAKHLQALYHCHFQEIKLPTNTFWHPTALDLS